MWAWIWHQFNLPNCSLVRRALKIPKRENRFREPALQPTTPSHLVCYFHFILFLFLPPFPLAFLAISSQTDLRPHRLTRDQKTNNSLSLFVFFFSARLAVSSTSLHFLPFFQHLVLQVSEVLPCHLATSLWGRRRKLQGDYEASTPTHLY